MADSPWNIEGPTRVVGVLGDPVEHSLSPRMHNAAFRALGLDYVYVPFRVDDTNVKAAVRAVAAFNLAGVNVTVPHKENVCRYVDALSSNAEDVGAVNTIFPRHGQLFGDNTDVTGFAAALRAHGFRLRGKRVLVIGAGGAARAVVYALMNGRATEIVVANRTISKAKRIARAFDARNDIIQPTGLQVLDDRASLGGISLVVNTTSVGLHGEGFVEYQPDATAPGCVHFDLAYRETLTPFLSRAAKAERPTIDGRHMLLHQGAIAFKHFTGRKAPLEVMAESIGIVA